MKFYCRPQTTFLCFKIFEISYIYHRNFITCKFLNSPIKINLIFQNDRVWRIEIVEEDIKGKVERSIRRFDIEQSDPLDGPEKLEITKKFGQNSRMDREQVNEAEYTKKQISWSLILPKI